MKRKCFLYVHLTLLCVLSWLATAQAKDLVPVQAVSSSVQDNRDDLQAAHAMDKNTSTRWSSNFSDPQWISLDFGSPRKFDFVTLVWETAYAKHYELQVSQDARNWMTIFRETDGDGTEDALYVGQQQSRYLRVYCIERGTIYGYSLFEIKVDLRDDQAIPRAPAKLYARAVDNVAYLDWADNTETDIRGYNIYRARQAQGRFEKKNSVPVRKSSYKDQTIKPRIPYVYYVTAVDYAGQESPASRGVEMIPSVSKKKTLHRIPAAAWKRVLGDLPDKPASSSPNRGIALGGFGAGSFMYNLSGSFGPFQSLDSVIYKAVWLPEAAFHIYEKIGNDQPVVKTLSTDTRLKPAWNRIHTGDATYYALQPRGWVDYHGLAHTVSMEFFSPVLPHNYQETSYPVGIWEFRAYNPSPYPSELSIMLTFPDVFVGQQLKAEGWANRFQAEGEYRGVVLKAAGELGEWCLAAKTSDQLTFSYVTSWNAQGDGRDVWDDFSADGVLGNQRLDQSDSAGAVAVKMKLEPGEQKVIPLVLAWDFPVVRFGQGTEWWKKYTEYFDRSGNNSFRIAREALEQYAEWELQISAWQQPVLASRKYPVWLKRAAFNELYYSQFGGIFYEAGLKSGHDQEYQGLHTEDHKFLEMECMLYPFANTLDVRHYSSVVYAYFWPEIEKELLINFADAIMHFDPQEHQTPHDSGSPWADPYFKWDHYGTNRHHWKDLHSKFIQQCWRYWHLYQDREFLDSVWPACQATYYYMKKTDTDGDGLPNNLGSDNTYDSWGLWGTSLLCGGLWIGALEAMEQLAESLDDPLAAEARSLLSRARRNLDKQLWYAKKGYYRIDTQSKHPTAIMADGLNGQRYCEAYGLPDILPKKRMRSHLKQVFRKCVVPLHDFTGDGVGDCGAINGIKEDGSLLGLGQSDEIWTGSSYFLAASMYHAGLRQEALKTAFGVYYLTYEEDSTAYWFNTPEAWHDKGIIPRPSDPEQYQRPRAVWELLLEIHNPYAIRHKNTKK